MEEDYDLQEKPREKFIEAEVSSLLKSCNINQAPISLWNILNHIKDEYNLTVLKSKILDKETSGFLKKEIDIYDEEAFTLGFNEKHPWVRNRFTISHEIGHLILGHSCDDYNNPKSKLNEKEADLFAGELLVPKNFLKEDYKKNTNLDLLSKIYCVSKEVLTIKLLKHRLVKFK